MPERNSKYMSVNDSEIPEHLNVSGDDFNLSEAAKSKVSEANTATIDKLVRGHLDIKPNDVVYWDIEEVEMEEETTEVAIIRAVDRSNRGV